MLIAAASLRRTGKWNAAGYTPRRKAGATPRLYAIGLFRAPAAAGLSVRQNATAAAVEVDAATAHPHPNRGASEPTTVALASAADDKQLSPASPAGDAARHMLVVQRGSGRAGGSGAIRMYGSHTFGAWCRRRTASQSGTSANVTSRSPAPSRCSSPARPSRHRRRRWRGRLHLQGNDSQRVY